MTNYGWPMQAETAVRPAADRVTAIDLARFVALAGMFAAHTWNRSQDGSHTLIGELVAGRAAALFAVLAGVGVVFVTRRALVDGHRGVAARLLLGRGAGLLIIGLTLGLLGSNVFVIIAYYGVLFWVMAPLVSLRTRWLVPIAVVLAVVGPIVNVALRDMLGTDYEVGSATWLDLIDPLTLLRGLLITGIYPAITWLVYGIVGIIVGRALLSAAGAAARRRLGVWLAGIGAAGVVAGLSISAVVLDALGGRRELAALFGIDGSAAVDYLLSDSGVGAPQPGSSLWLWAASPHTGTVPDLLITCGIALIVIGLCLVLVAAPSPLASRVLLPFTGMGSVPLTVYSVHVFLTAAVPELASALSPPGPLPFVYSSSPGLYLAHLAVGLLIGTLFALLHSKGPLETLVMMLGQLAAGTLRLRRLGPPNADVRPARDEASGGHN